MNEPSGRDIERNVSAAVRIAWLEDQLRKSEAAFGIAKHGNELLQEENRELRALLAAKDEALRSVDDDLQGWSSPEEPDGQHTGLPSTSDLIRKNLRMHKTIRDALSLTTADALKRHEAMERVVEGARAMRDACLTPRDWCKRYHCRGVCDALAALEEVDKAWK